MQPRGSNIRVLLEKMAVQCLLLHAKVTAIDCMQQPVKQTDPPNFLSYKQVWDHCVHAKTRHHKQPWGCKNRAVLETLAEQGTVVYVEQIDMETSACETD